MPCSKCGRTAKLEWLAFFFCRKPGLFLCSFCDQLRPAAENGITFNPPAIRQVAVLSISVIFIMFVFWASWFGGDFVDAYYQEKNGPEPSFIEEVTPGEEVRLFGRINSTEDWVVFKSTDEHGRKYTEKLNFTLVQGNVSIFVVMSNDTDVYKVSEMEKQEGYYRDGDLVHVIGTVEEGKENGTNHLRASQLMDQEFDPAEAKQGLLFLKYAMGFLGLFMFCSNSFFHLVLPFHGSLRARRRAEPQPESISKLLAAEKEVARAQEEMKQTDMMKNKLQVHYRALFIFFFLLFTAYVLGYLWLVTVLGTDDKAFTLGTFLMLSAFIPSFLLMFTLDRGSQLVREFGVSEKGLVVLAEAREPLFIPWERVIRVVRWKELTISLTGENRNRSFRLSRNITEAVIEAWGTGDLSRYLEDRKGSEEGED